MAPCPVPFSVCVKIEGFTGDKASVPDCELTPLHTICTLALPEPARPAGITKLICVSDANSTCACTPFTSTCGAGVQLRFVPNSDRIVFGAACPCRKEPPLTTPPIAGGGTAPVAWKPAVILSGPLIGMAAVALADRFAAPVHAWNAYPGLATAVSVTIAPVL